MLRRVRVDGDAVSRSAARAAAPALRAPQLAQLVAERFGVTVHPRSIERALSQPEKNRR